MTYIVCRYSCQWWNTGAHAKDSESTENLQETQNSTPKHTPATFLSTVLRTQPSSGAGGNTGGATHDAHALSDEPTLQEGGGMPDFEEWTYDQDLVFNGVPAERWKYKLKVCVLPPIFPLALKIKLFRCPLTASHRLESLSKRILRMSRNHLRNIVNGCCAD